MHRLTSALFRGRSAAGIAGIALIFVFLIWPASLLVANQSRDIRVSATIPPRLCQYPNACAQVVENKLTKLVVQDQTIRYIGASPLVVTSAETLTILF